MKNRLLLICLDAFDIDISNRLIAEGKLKNLADFKSQSACFPLEHGEGGRARYTGLTWEHFTSGLKPETANKWSVISFDAQSYQVHQSFSTLAPFVAEVDAKAVVFDVPYFALDLAPNVQGISGWGGHDTGMYLASSPPSLIEEIDARFGPRPDISELNTMVYPNADATSALADKLTKSVERRTDIVEWLFKERLPDWDLAAMAFAESHDVIELMYHGMDDKHHAATFDSAKPARQGVEMVYEAIADAISRLQKAFPDVTLATVAMHGMGHNDTDLPTMILLPEFMYRYNFGGAYFRGRDSWRSSDSPALLPGESWQSVVVETMQPSLVERAKEVGAKIKRKLGFETEDALSATNGSRNLQNSDEFSAVNVDREARHFSIDWMPSCRYQKFWPKMKAFAMPGYFDGRIRINLEGREQAGKVSLASYRDEVDRIIGALNACVDTKTGQKVVREIHCPVLDDPFSISATQGDIHIIWAGSPIGFEHPKYGAIGPAPLRRMGGHSGELGAMYIYGAEALAAGEYPLRSSFDVAPTVLELLGASVSNPIDGKSVLRQ